MARVGHDDSPRVRDRGRDALGDLDRQPRVALAPDDEGRRGERGQQRLELARVVLVELREVAQVQRLPVRAAPVAEESAS